MKRDKWPGCVQCLVCKEVLVSNSRHDFNQCWCDNDTFVDGGYDYLRYGGINMSKIRVLKLSVAKRRKVK